jgi:TolB-like protein
MKRFLFAVAFLSLSISSFLYAQERMAVLPLTGSGVDASTQETTHMLLVSEISKLKKYDVISKSEIEAIAWDRDCAEVACAVEIGKQANAAKVVFGSLNKLGEKVILQYTLVEVSTGQTLVSDDLSALRVEDLDQVVKRVAASIVQEVPVAKTVEVGLVTEQESQEAKTRKANSSWGVAFGYLYPQKGYDDERQIFVWDFRSLYEMRQFAVDAVLGLRQGFALNVGFLYLPSRKDFSPFVGAGVGFHGVSHKQFYSGPYYYEYGQSEKTSDGVEFLIKGGLLAFRTYDFRVIATVEYSITLNDYDDRAIVVTIGVLRGGKKIFGIF